MGGIRHTATQAMALAAAVKASQTLRSLDISANPGIQREALPDFIVGVSGSAISMLCVDLGANATQLSGETLALVCKALEGQDLILLAKWVIHTKDTLHHVDLADNNGMFESAAQEAPFGVFCEALCSATQLETICLAGLDMDTAGESCCC
jgi:hypothetical protein